MGFYKYNYDMSVEVDEDEQKLNIKVDAPTAEFIVEALSQAHANDEVTKLIALGVCELALSGVPMSRLITGEKL